MSFEDLQKKWGGQFSEGADPSSQRAEAKLLAQIRQSSRRFYWQVGLQALRDVVYLACLGAVGTFMVHPDSFSPARVHSLVYAIWVAFGLVIAFTVALTILRGQPGVSAAGSVASGRLRHESRRFNAMVLWWDLEKATVGLFLIFAAVNQAFYVHHYQALSWSAAALYACSLLAFFASRLRTQKRKPAADGTVLGMLTQAIHQTRGHIQMLEEARWYLGLLIAGALLMGPVRGLLTTGAPTRNAFISLAVLFAISRAVWKSNQWIARRRWRPRLEQLEKLKSEFADSLL